MCLSFIHFDDSVETNESLSQRIIKIALWEQITFVQFVSLIVGFAGAINRVK